MTAQAFVDAVMQIASEQPSYRLGGSGVDGTCDCVGLVMGAINRIQKRNFPLHSSNYFARTQMATLEKVDDANLVVGMLVYKARDDTEQLHERYRRGGRYDNGDYRDFYHVGVVCDVSPTTIVHCTSSNDANGIVFDRSTKGWTHMGRLIGLEHDVSHETFLATVKSENGKGVNLRRSPSENGDYITKIPEGNEVEVHADAEGWAKVSWLGLTGYCMSKFLAYREEEGKESIESRLDKIIELLKKLVEK